MTRKTSILTLTAFAAVALAVLATTAQAAGRDGSRSIQGAPPPPGMPEFERAKPHVNGGTPPGPASVALGPTIPTKIGANIVAKLTGNAVGFAYAVAKDGQVVTYDGVGDARIAQDGYQEMTSSSRLNVMSVTKATTAVATLQLLQQNDLSVDSPVAPWLPADWKRGPGFEIPKSQISGFTSAVPAPHITFRQLLDHKSGLRQKFNALKELGEHAPWGNDWDGLEFVVATGTQVVNGQIDTSGPDYKNANYALLRVAIPALWKATGDNPEIGAISKENVGSWYLAYMGQHVFGPSGIDGISCTAADPDTAALAYDASQPEAGGKLVSSSPEKLDGCGGDKGLHLSALDLGRFMANLGGGTLLDAETVQLMDSGKLGWDGASNGAYWKGGDGFWTGGGAKREIHTCVAKLPNGIQAALVINSSNLSGQGTCTILRTAYTEATS
jgi:CubicO group peptidase (beta-lactamase class C family)